MKWQKQPYFGDQQQKHVGLGFGPAEGPETTTTGECQNSAILEAKKRKRRVERKPSLDTGPIDDSDYSCNRLEIKKSKKDDPNSAQFSGGSEERVEGERSDLGSNLKREKGSDLGSSLKGDKVEGCSGLVSDLNRGRNSYFGSCSNREKGKGFSDLGSILERGKSSDLNREQGKEVSELGSNLKGGESSDLGCSLNREKGKGCVLGSEQSESLESGKYSNMGFEFEDLLKQVEGKYVDLGVTEKKKKRKRDEIEAEYKERQCGAMGMNEGGEGGFRGGRVVGEKRKHVDAPVDMMMVSKDDGSDEEAILSRTVFVGNLPLKVKKAALVKEFSQFGEIESVRIRSVPLLDTKVAREGAINQKKVSDTVDSVQAYIVFKTEEAAQASLANDRVLVGGNQVRIDRACPPRKKLKVGDAPLYDNKRTVVVGNLPFDVKDEEIFQLFSGIKDLESSIEAIRVIRDSCTSVGKGIAYVLFKTRGGADLVLEKRRLKLRDHELRLHHASSKLTPSKRKNSSPGEREDTSAKKLAVDLRTPDNSNKVKTKSGSSLQGLQAMTSGASEQAGGKRKLESQTPESYRLKKKQKKLRRD